MTKTKLDKTKSELKKLIKDDQSELKNTDIGIPDNIQKSTGIKYFVILIASISAMVGIGFLFSSSQTYANKVSEAEEIARPANIGIIKLTTSDCDNCFDIDNAIEDLKNQGVEVTSVKEVDYKSEEGVESIDRYQINQLPTYVAIGDLRKTEGLEFYLSKNTDLQLDFAVFTNILPVYYDVQNQIFRGQITVTYISDKNCKECNDQKQTVDNYKDSGVMIAKELTYEWDSTKGQELINKYKIKKIPTFLFDKEAAVYENIVKAWDSIGIIQNDIYVTTQIHAPFRNTNDGKIKGLVTLIEITDDSCDKCYKLKQLEEIITQNFGVYINTKKTFDINSKEGQSYIQKYKITKAPTVLLSTETDEYTSLINTWEKIGSIESDGWLIFRDPLQLGEAIIYKDLTSGNIVEP